MLLLLAAVGCGDRGKAPARRGGSDAALKRAPARDAGPPVAPRAANRLALGQGCSCEAMPAEAAASHLAARRTAVARMDGINEGLRRFIEALDTEAGPKDAALADPAPHVRRLRGITCLMDCLLHQFLGFTRPAWAYLEQVASFVDKASVVLGRLALAPEGRTAGPGTAELTAAYNEVARRSNLSIGLAVLAPAEPAPTQALDSLAFGAKTRRQAARMGEVLATHLQPWLDEGGRAPAPRPPNEPAALRVALARLRQELGAQARGGKALECDRGEACKTTGPRWATVLATLGTLTAATLRVDAALRQAQAEGRPLDQGAMEALWKRVDQARKAWEEARAAPPGKK